MKLSVVKSHLKDKKLDAIFDDGGHKKTISFGAAGYSDFTKHHDEARKARYDDRHKKNENWNDPMTAGALSKFILWDSPTIKQGVKKFKNKFGII